MKILLCKSHFAGPVSGSDETLVAYATNLQRQGYRPTVVLLYAPAKNDQYYARLRDAGVEVITIVSHPVLHSLLAAIRSFAYWFAAFVHLPSRPLNVSRGLWQRVSQSLSLIYQRHCRLFFEQYRPDLIHVLTPDPGAAVMIRAGAAAKVAVLYQELGTPHHLRELDIPYQNFSRVLPLCSSVAALSPRLAHQWEEKLAPENPISVLPLLVEDGFHVEKTLPISPAPVTFGFAARLEKGKGPLILLDAFAHVSAKINNSTLQIAGGGPEEHAVKTRVADLGLHDTCELRGIYKTPEEKRAFMKGLDVFVLPTLAEGTPNSIIEAMAHGLPVIASAVGGVPDLVTRETGILVPPGDAAALSDAMMLLATDAHLRLRMGQAARTRYEALFSPDVVVPMLMDTYRRTATASENGNHHAAGLPHPWTETTTKVSRPSPRLKGRRVIFVFGNLELGGAERQALIVAKHLVEHEQATVEVWGFNKSGPVAKICDDHGIRWRVVPYPFRVGRLRRFANLVKVARLLRNARPDILLPYTAVPNTVCGLLWKWTGAQVCVWNQRDEGIVPLNARWERRAVQRTPQFISNSNAGARFLIEKLNVEASQVRVIQNGIAELKPELDRHAWRERLEIDETDFVGCMVANLHANKDHETLLKAWRIVVDELELRGRKAVLVLAGRHDGAYESLVALSYQLRLDSNVRFAGHVSDVAGLLSAVDVGVFSSRSEGCPNGVLESMAAGLPVVGTDIEGIREALGESGLPLLSPPGDAQGLARTVLKLANDAQFCETIGAENRTRVAEKYAAQRLCEATVSVIAQL